jgi:hypothetical protein
MTRKEIMETVRAGIVSQGIQVFKVYCDTRKDGIEGKQLKYIVSKPVDCNAINEKLQGFIVKNSQGANWNAYHGVNVQAK